MNSSPFSKIKSFYCLNLKPNVERWNDSVTEFIKVGLNYVERIECIESEENRYLSFNKSHYDTIKKGLETGEPFGIFEDDIAFDVHWKHLESAMNELPEDWDALYLGANICGDWELPTRVSVHLSRLPNAFMTHAIVYSKKGAQFVADNFNPDTFPVYDEWLRVTLMPHGNVYLVNPMMCYQRPVYSDVWKGSVNYVQHHIDGNKILRRL